jgi:hypothetical protein
MNVQKNIVAFDKPYEALQIDKIIQKKNKFWHDGFACI